MIELLTLCTRVCVCVYGCVCAVYMFWLLCSALLCREETFFKIVHRLMSKHMHPAANPLKDGTQLKDVRSNSYHRLACLLLC